MSPRLHHVVLFAALSLNAGAIAGLASGQQVAGNPSSNSSESLRQAPSALSQQQQMSASSLQAHLNAMQAQAQRQIGQLNGIVMNAVNGSKYSNVLEAISNVGKAIHQQISAASNHVNIITAPTGPSGLGESANNKKNEYQSIVTTDQGSSLVSLQDQLPLSSNQSRVIAAAPAANGQPVVNYREQGELLRQDILRRAGQLQAIVSSSMDLLKNNGDQIVRRLLEQMNVRLDQAKAKADRIINEPATNDIALKALSTINLSLNHLNTIISNIVNRLDQANKENQNQLGAAAAAAGSASISQRQQGPNNPIGTSLPQLLDANKFRTNLHQLGQQFHSVLNNSQLHQQLLALRQRQQQQMSLLQLPSRQQQASQPAQAPAPQPVASMQ